jgi:hypothetical protein
MDDLAAPAEIGQHIVARLKSRIGEVRALGFQVRQEVLGAHQPDWCEINGKKVLFLDASHSAREQLESIDEALARFDRAQTEC